VNSINLTIVFYRAMVARGVNACPNFKSEASRLERQALKRFKVALL
jgi:hypothetical protein